MMSAISFDAKQLNEDKEHEGSCEGDQGRESATGNGDRSRQCTRHVCSRRALHEQNQSLFTLQSDRSSQQISSMQVISSRSIQHGTK